MAESEEQDRHKKYSHKIEYPDGHLALAVYQIFEECTDFRATRPPDAARPTGNSGKHISRTNSIRVLKLFSDMPLSKMGPDPVNLCVTERWMDRDWQTIVLKPCEGYLSSRCERNIRMATLIL